MRHHTVILDDYVGSPCVWIVWALKPGEAVHLGAVCSSETMADKYIEQLPAGIASFRGAKMLKEKVVLNHGFGYHDSIQNKIIRHRD